MINIQKAASRFTADHGWLKSNFSFSFADHYDPDNMGFGPLRVLNDDIIQPGNGFGAHPHHEMEIVSIVLRGQLKHEDSTGNTEVLIPGEIQRMTAGTGIVHSEFNPSDSEEACLLQLWFLPNRNGLTPSYEQLSYNEDKMNNALLSVVAGSGIEGAAHINQDLTLYLSDLEDGKSIAFTQGEGRRIFLFVIEGELSLQDGSVLSRRDAARITDQHSIEMTAIEDAKFMLIDLP